MRKCPAWSGSRWLYNRGNPKACGVISLNMISQTPWPPIPAVFCIKGKRMLKTIFAIMAVGFASNAGAAQLTIAEKLADIMASKEQIRQAIETKGVSVPSNTPLSQYGAKIGQISACHATGFVVRSVDFCVKIISSSTVLSINSIFSSICSPLSATAKFPYVNCGGSTPADGTNTYDWTSTSCPLVSTTATIYGNARCSTQRDTAGHGNTSTDNTVNGICYRATNEPSNNPGTGVNCWCQLCTNSSKTSCGGWVFLYIANTASVCASQCAYACGFTVADTYPNNRTFRAALCAAPAP